MVQPLVTSSVFDKIYEIVAMLAYLNLTVVEVPASYKPKYLIDSIRLCVVTSRNTDYRLEDGIVIFRFAQLECWKNVLQVNIGLTEIQVPQFFEKITRQGESNAMDFIRQKHRKGRSCSVILVEVIYP